MLDNKQMRFSRRNILKNYYIVCGLIFLCTIIYNEFIIYYVNKQYWSTLTCNNTKECTKILFVADPQIIGNYQENLHVLTPFSIWDCDKYLHSTYVEAYDFVQPDIVIFLGDLMDEGSTALELDFRKYVRRLFNIFLVGHLENVKHIWLPGDNDIGGEGRDYLTLQKIQRFQHAFDQPDIIPYKNITFFKINRMAESIPVYKKSRNFYDINEIFIGLSHMPLMVMPNIFVEKILSKMLPHALFTAHEHTSKIITNDPILRTNRRITPINLYNYSIFEYQLGITDLYEFLVPTCSYRMGTDQIGYGSAIIEKNNLRYTVLWSPPRFRSLLIYFLLLMLFALLAIFMYVLRKRNKKTVNKATGRTRYSPLPY